MQKFISNAIFCLGLITFGFGLNRAILVRIIGGTLIIIGIISDPKVWSFIKRKHQHILTRHK